MAINPNTDFSVGQVLTSDQTNRFPRGVVSFAERTTNLLGVSTEQVAVTSSTFTAVANRYYRITFSCHYVGKNATAGALKWRIRKTNATGTQYQYAETNVSASTANGATLVVVRTLDAGSQAIVGTVEASAGLLDALAAATYPIQITVEDLGPA